MNIRYFLVVCIGIQSGNIYALGLTDDLHILTQKLQNLNTLLPNPSPVPTPKPTPDVKKVVDIAIEQTSGITPAPLPTMPIPALPTEEKNVLETLLPAVPQTPKGPSQSKKTSAETLQELQKLREEVDIWKKPEAEQFQPPSITPEMQEELKAAPLHRPTSQPVVAPPPPSPPPTGSELSESSSQTPAGGPSKKRQRFPSKARTLPQTPSSSLIHQAETHILSKKETANVLKAMGLGAPSYSEEEEPSLTQSLTESLFAMPEFAVKTDAEKERAQQEARQTAEGQAKVAGQNIALERKMNEMLPRVAEGKDTPAENWDDLSASWTEITPGTEEWWKGPPSS